MNILIIGGSGTLGKRLTEQLINKKNNIIVICRDKPKDYDIQKSNLQYFFMDYYKNKLQIKKILKKKIDIVINFICFNKKHAKEDFDLFKNYNLKKYFFISAAGIYKDTKKKIDENSKIDINNYIYLKDKAEAENYFLEKDKKNLFPTKIIRPSHIYDKENIPTLFKSRSFTFLKNFKKTNIFYLTSKYDSKRSFLHAKDFAKILKAIIYSKKEYNNILNIVPEKNLTWKVIYKYYAEFLNNKVKFKYFDIEKLKKRNIQIYKHLEMQSRNHVFNTKKIKSICGKITYLNTKKELKKIIDKKIKFLDNFEEDKMLLKKIDEISD